MDKIVITANHISKEYRYYRTNHQRLSHLILGRDKGEKMHALRDVSFEISAGEKVAVIGNPGSGKSTLLRILSGIIEPDSGSTHVEGRVTQIFDHKAGMSSSLSGLDNIMLKAAVIGCTGDLTDDNISNIIQFAGIEELKDMPMRTYPSGTPTVLGFTVATEIKPDILIYGESFSFGGRKGYKSRCIDRLEALASDPDVTFVLEVSNFPFARKVCTRGIVLDQGVIVFDGPYKEAVKLYKEQYKSVSAEVQPPVRHGRQHDRAERNTEADDF